MRFIDLIDTSTGCTLSVHEDSVQRFLDAGGYKLQVTATKEQESVVDDTTPKPVKRRSRRKKEAG